MKHWLGALTVVAALSVAAQEASANRTLLLAMAMNAKRMMQYEWKQRITVIHNGKPAEPVIDQVRFDSSGQMQRTTLSAPPKPTGIRGRIAASVREEVKEIMELAARYNKPQQMLEAVRRGELKSSPGAGSIELNASAVIQSNDSMTMSFDGVTHSAKHANIQTSYDGEPMTISQDYSPLPGGPNVMKRIKVSVPQKELEIDVDSYDFTRQTAGIH